MATPGSPDESQSHLKSQISELEKAFQDCVTNLTSQEYFAPNESDETKQTVEQTLQNFLDTARRIEAFFLSQRLRLAVQKPEQVLKEDILELRHELERKEKLVEKHHERLQSWQNLLMRSTVAPAPPTTSSTASGGSQAVLAPSQQNASGFPGPPQGMGMSSQHMGMGQPGQYPGPPAMPAQGYSMPPPQQPPPSYSQNPLTYLEQNLSNIGMPERR